MWTLVTLVGTTNALMTTMQRRCRGAGESGVSVVAVRMTGRRVVRIGDREAPLAADESILLRRT